MYLLCTGAHRSQKMASGLLELELQMVVSRHVDSRKQILALWKHIQGSYLLILLSSPLAFPLLRNSSDYIITFIRKCTSVSHPMLGWFELCSWVSKVHSDTRPDLGSEAITVLQCGCCHSLYLPSPHTGDPPPTFPTTQSSAHKSANPFHHASFSVAGSVHIDFFEYLASCYTMWLFNCL